MYRLTLTRNERNAIDWIGQRHEHGFDFYQLICKAEWSIAYENEPTGLDFDWSSEHDLTFTFDESTAWEVQDLLEDCHFECFSGELVTKLMNFVGAIV